MSTINERIKEIIETLYKGSQRAFAEAIGTSSSVVNGIVGKRQSSPSFELTQKISAVASISPEWLLFGRGKMLIDRNEHRDKMSDIVREYSLKNVSDVLGITMTELGQYTNDTEPPGVNFDPIPFYPTILNAFPKINPNWLYHNEGEMLKKESQLPSFENTRHTNTPIVREYPLKARDVIVDEQSIPLYGVEATAGILEQGDINDYVIDRIHIPRMPKCDGAVFVIGDSMTPVINSGDIVLYKIFEDVTNIIFGNIYLVSLVIEGDTLILIKYVNKVQNKPTHVLLCSENPKHAPMEVALSSIRSIALIKASIRYHTM